ncbi:hypothetical protein PspTeo4_14008 [Pseudomonas sp. Teo4]|nr:hypothetical protein [Pseudomonas sp. Teo4]
MVGEECLANLQATEGLPDLPLWLVNDPENPWAGEWPEGLDRQFADNLACAPRSPFPREHRAGIEAQAPTLLIFTSGTTGLPKAARYSHMRWLSSGM